MKEKNIMRTTLWVNKVLSFRSQKIRMNEKPYEDNPVS